MSRQGEDVTYQHLLILTNANPLPLNDLHILQPRQNLMMNLKGDLDTKRRPLFDLERFILEGVDGVGRGEIDDHVGTTFDRQGEGFDDAFARVGRVADRGAGVEAERGFPSVESFVVLVCCDGICAIGVRTRGLLLRRGGSTSSTSSGTRGESAPSCVYSWMVFFSPTLNPSVREAARSSSWWSAIVYICVGVCVQVLRCGGDGWFVYCFGRLAGWSERR